jgi:hypothetical protein
MYLESQPPKVIRLNTSFMKKSRKLFGSTVEGRSLNAYIWNNFDQFPLRMFYSAMDTSSKQKCVSMLIFFFKSCAGMSNL